MCLHERDTRIMDSEKIALPHPLPVPTREPPDVLLLQRTIKSLEQENAWLKERVAESLMTLAGTVRI
jgi:hypothetical protein